MGVSLCDYSRTVVGFSRLIVVVGAKDNRVIKTHPSDEILSHESKNDGVFGHNPLYLI